MKNPLLKSLLSFALLLYSASFVKAQNCTVNAGISASVCAGSPISLDGSLGGSFDPATITWSVVSQPAGAAITIANAHSLLTNTSVATVPGVYSFRLAANCTIGGTAFQNISYTVNALPPVPSITTPGSTTTYPCYIEGTPVNLAGTPPPSGGVSVRWESNLPGNFSAQNAASTTFTPSFAPDECNPTNVFTITYTVTQNGCSQSTTRMLTFQRNYGPIAAAPSVNPVCGTSVTMKGTCPGNGTASWTLLSKPAGAANPVITNATTRIATVSGLVAGDYQFQYTITGGCSSGSTIVNVTATGSAAVTPANAGVNQYFCSWPSLINLKGNTPAVGETATWTAIEGGPISISNPANPSTDITGLASAVNRYAFLYTISNGNCSTTDTVYLVVRPSLTLTGLNDINTCIDNAFSGTFYQHYIASYGTFRYPDLDTVYTEITYLSGPLNPPAVVDREIQVINGTLLPSAVGKVRILPGLTYSDKLFGDRLYPPSLLTSSNPNQFMLRYNMLMNSTNAGTHKFRITYSNGCESKTGDVTITFGNTTAAANAGSNLQVPCGATTSSLAGNLPPNFPAGGLGAWSTVQLPSGATDPINTNNYYLRNPTLNNLIPGTYVFRYTANSGPSCAPKGISSTTMVVSNDPPPVPNAGADITICGGSYQLSGSAIPDGVLGSWSLVSPADPGVSFDNRNIANPLVSGLQVNTAYTFRYTFENGCDTTTDDVVITTNNTAGPTKPDLTTSGTFNCSVSNVPAASTVASATFTAITNPADGIAISSFTQNPSTVVNSITLTATPNVYNLSLTFPLTVQQDLVGVVFTASSVSCPSNTVSDTVYLQFIRSGTTITKSGNAGAPQNFCSVTSFPFTATLTGNNLYLGRWTQATTTSGQNAVIANDRSLTTSVSFPAPGIYRFSWATDPAIPNYSSSGNGCNSTPGYTQVIVASPASIALAGDDITYCAANGTTNLNATPLTSGTGKWSLYQSVDGARPTIADLSSPTSAITFSGSGIAILQWSTFGDISECGVSSSDLVTVTYTAPARAGNDQSLCGVSATTLNAADPSPALGQWSQVSGPSAATISDPGLATTAVTGLQEGTYVFRFTVQNADASCLSTDDVQVTVANIVSPANAGVDFMSCSAGSNSAHLAASSAPLGYTGTWQLVSKPSTAPVGSFSNVNDPAAIYNGFTVQGTYDFRWTISNGVCSSTDFITVSAGPTACTLPVELIRFTGTITNDCGIELHWKSAREINFDYYSVERSYDGVNYEQIATVKGLGSNNEEHGYRYLTSKETAPAVFYRLRMVDLDGSFKYSPVISLRLPCGAVTDLKVLPNPAPSQGLTKALITTDKIYPKGFLVLINAQGALMAKQPVVLQKGLNTITLNTTTISTGMYLVEWRDGDGKMIKTTKLVIY